MKQDLKILSPMIQKHLEEAQSFDQIWDRLRGEVVDCNRGRSVERIPVERIPVERIPELGCTVYLKRFEGILRKNHRKITRTEPRVTTQAEREVRIIEALDRAGFGVPEILLWGSEIEKGRESRSLLLTEELPAQALDQLSPELLDKSLLARVANELGRTVAAGVFLPDLGLDHIFVGSEGRLFLLDFHNARCSKTPSRRELGRALIRFYKSPGAERARQALSFEEFAAIYLEAAGRPEAMERALGLARKRLPGAVGGDSSWRYEESGKAAAFAARSGKRDKEEQGLLTKMLEDLHIDDQPGHGGLGRCLDAGSGTGRLQGLIENHGGSWLGMDASRGMLLEAKQSGRSPLLLGSVSQIPFAEEAFDTVICFRLLHHLEPEVQAQILRELARVCKRRLILSAFHPLSTHEWTRAFKARFLGTTRGRFPTPPTHLARSLPGFSQQAILRQGPLRDLYVSLWTRD